MHLRWSIVLVMIGFLMVSGSARERRCDPSTGRLRLLYIGDCVSGMHMPTEAMRADPTFSLTLVPASGWLVERLRIQRMLRVYLPRTLKALEESYDLILLSDADPRNLRTEILSWFKNSVSESGLGLVMVGGAESFGGGTSRPFSWEDTSVAEVLPVKMFFQQEADDVFKTVVLDENDPLMKSLPWETSPVFLGANVVEPRQGSRYIAKLKGVSIENPYIVWWDFNAGRTLAFTPDWTPYYGMEFIKWRYYGDAVSNIMYYTCGLVLPADPELVSELRRHFKLYHAQRSYLVSLAEFLDSFGANPAPLEAEIVEIEKLRIKAEEEYLRQDYQTSLQTVQAMLEAINSQHERAVEIRKRALLWVYLIEWSVVTATFMVTGVALWTLMVRRRLYKEVSITSTVGRRPRDG